MRNPNGYGGIYKQGGKRRKPYCVRVTNGWEIDKESNKTKQTFQIVGYFATKQEAMIALSDFNKNPYSLDSEKITFEEIYDKWSDKKFEEVSSSNVNGYKAAWQLLQPIHDMRFVDVKLSHLQNIADNSGKNRPTLKKYKTLLKGIYEYAVKHDVINDDANKIKYLEIDKAGNPNALLREPFTKVEIERLWKSVDANEYISVVLILIYTGCRISELLNLKKCDVNLESRYFNIIESKTDAGIRTVPIAKKIMPFITFWVNKNNCDNLISTPEGMKMTYRNYFDSYWRPLLHAIDMDSHRPHDTRHTCVSLLTSAKVDERFIQKIVGHKGQNVTRTVYTHLEIEELIIEMDKI